MNSVIMLQSNLYGVTNESFSNIHRRQVLIHVQPLMQKRPVCICLNPSYIYHCSHQMPAKREAFAIPSSWHGRTKQPSTQTIAAQIAG